MRVLVTGGLGFIGSEFARRRVETGDDVVNIDAHSYAASPARLEAVTPPLETIRADVGSLDTERMMRAFLPTVVVHFAAETHVTRSERDEGPFWRSNVRGTARLLAYAAGCRSQPRVVHVSTDEVYGPCVGKPFREKEKLQGEGAATSAYARSKALADDIARAASDRLDVVVVRPSNVFGPWQHPEKAIARWITRALLGLDLPVWGGGRQVRDWMFLGDACRGIDTVLQDGKRGEAYNLAPESRPIPNLTAAQVVAEAARIDPTKVYLAAYDRPNHDLRYAIDASKARALGWSCAKGFAEGVNITVQWYRQNEQWWKPLVSESEALYQDAQRRAAR